MIAAILAASAVATVLVLAACVAAGRDDEHGKRRTDNSR